MDFAVIVGFIFFISLILTLLVLLWPLRRESLARNKKYEKDTD